MTPRARLDAVFMAAAALVAAWLGLLRAGAGPDTAGAFLVVTNLAHVLLLALASLTARQNAQLLGAGNPVRAPWLLLGAGLLAFLAAESVDAWYEVVARQARPFPSVVDALFVLGYLFVVPAFVAFIRVYRAWGGPMGNPRGDALVAVLAAVALAAVAINPLRAILHGDATAGQRLFHVLYPGLDCMLLVLIAVLVRITGRFRGGQVWRVWALLLAGFAFTALADLMFAFLPAVGVPPERSLMEALYLLSYLAIARGALQQRQMLEA